MPGPRSVRTLAVVAVAAVTLSAASPAVARIRPGRLGIGDSVMLGAKSALQARGFHIVDAAVSRQFNTVAGRVRYWRDTGRLPRNVVIHLGNNGTIDIADCYAAVRVAGPHRKVFLVSLKVPRAYRVQDNITLIRCAARFPNVYMIDWSRFSHPHPGWFYSDGYHLRPAGRTAYAALVSHQISLHG